MLPRGSLTVPRGDTSCTWARGSGAPGFSRSPASTRDGSRLAGPWTPTSCCGCDQWWTAPEVKSIPPLPERLQRPWSALSSRAGLRISPPRSVATRPRGTGSSTRRSGLVTSSSPSSKWWWCPWSSALWWSGWRLWATYGDWVASAVAPSEPSSARRWWRLSSGWAWPISSNRGASSLRGTRPRSWPLTRGRPRTRSWMPLGPRPWRTRSWALCPRIRWPHWPTETCSRSSSLR